MSPIKKLHELRDYCQNQQTQGLPENIIADFCQRDPRLVAAIDYAYLTHSHLKNEYSELLKLPENEQISQLQGKFVNFYAPDTVNPYVPLGAQGPWIVTSCGSVIYDTGGYGMLGLGHAPSQVLESLSEPYVMANIMTASFWQKKFSEALDREIGHNRPNQDDLFSHYLCLNSGSEAVTVAARISDVQAKQKAGNKKIKFLALKGSFHGRTDRPAQASDSTRPTYQQHLASFSNLDNLVTIEPNNCQALRQAFEDAKAENVFFETMLIEPVMGEGNPGKALTPEFYSLARELTEKNGTLLLVDSIQAGLRAHGCLSIVDYPGFTHLPVPDMETYSKALNAGQYPLSVLALNKKTANLYVKGIYGNTMTTNPRALATGCAVLSSLTPKLRANIIAQGKEFLHRLSDLQNEFKNIITNVQGTGLIFSAEINPKYFTIVGVFGLETYLRKAGLGVIHGGKNSLRFTPVFDISTAEVELVINILKHALQNCPKNSN